MDGEAGLIQYTMAHGLTENSRKVHVNFAKESRYSAIVGRWKLVYYVKPHGILMEFSRKSHGNFLIYVSSELSPFSISSFSLPGDDFVNDGLLFAGGAAQVDAGGFYALVAHQVGE